MREEANLYAMVGNNPLSFVDPFGLAISTKCCGAEARQKGLQQLQAYAKAYFDAQNKAGTPRGSYPNRFTNPKNSCNTLNFNLLNSFDPMPPCWSCVLENRATGKSWVSRDHWLVVCTPKDESGKELESERVTFDYWDKAGNPDGGNYDDFKTKYPEEGEGGTWNGPPPTPCSQAH